MRDLMYINFVYTFGTIFHDYSIFYIQGILPLMFVLEICDIVTFNVQKYTSNLIMVFTISTIKCHHAYLIRYIINC